VKGHMIFLNFFISDSQKPLQMMRGYRIILIIQKTKNVEPVGPAQHFLFEYSNIIDGKPRDSFSDHA
jgi:hypothetical protein